MEYYNEEIADNPAVEMILMAGESEDALAAWATKTKMPWPMILEEDSARMKKIKELRPRGWPTYYLLDAEGEVLAKGSSHAVKAKVKELTAGETA